MKIIKTLSFACTIFIICMGVNSQLFQENSLTSHQISEEVALKMVYKYHLRNQNNYFNLKIKDPITFTIDKNQILGLINKIKEQKSSSLSGRLVIRFASDSEQNNYKNLGIFLTGFIQDKKENYNYLPSSDMIQCSPKMFKIENGNEDIFESYIKRVSFLNDDSKNIEKGGIAHLVFTNEVLSTEETIEGWLLNTYFENNIVYLYPAIDLKNKYSTIVFSNDGELVKNIDYKLVGFKNFKKSYYDKGNSCCPPEQ